MVMDLDHDRLKEVALNTLEDESDKTLASSPVYWNVLQSHFIYYPNDDKFLFTPKGTSGYGTITCIEQNCWNDIPLGPSAAIDGGRKEGVGSFEAFHQHINTSLAHRTARDKRVAEQKQHATVASTQSKPAHTPTAKVPKHKVKPRHYGSLPFSSVANGKSPALDWGNSTSQPLPPAATAPAPSTAPAKSKSAPENVVNSQPSPTPGATVLSKAKKASLDLDPDSSDIEPAALSSSPLGGSRVSSSSRFLGVGGSRRGKGSSPPTSINIDDSDDDPLMRLDSPKPKVKPELSDDEVSILPNRASIAPLTGKKRTSDAAGLPPASSPTSRIRLDTGDPFASRSKKDKGNSKVKKEESPPFGLVMDLDEDEFPNFAKGKGTITKASSSPVSSFPRISPSPVASGSGSVTGGLKPKDPNTPTQAVPKHLEVPDRFKRAGTDDTMMSSSTDDSLGIGGPDRFGADSEMPTTDTDDERPQRYPPFLTPKAGPSRKRKSSPCSAARSIAFKTATQSANALMDADQDIGNAVNGGDDLSDAGPSRFRIGPPAQASGEIEEGFKKAVEGVDFEGKYTVAKARDLLQLGPKDTVASTEIELMPHQVIGLAWMLEQEKSKNKGGILGDEMGLGKTILTVALMCSNNSNDSKKKTTLILAPLALLTQWQDEIDRWVDDGFLEVLIYHSQAGSKPKRKKDLQKYDVILTTLDTLKNEWVDDEVDPDKKSKGKKKKRKSALSSDDDFVVDDESDEYTKSSRKRKTHGPLLSVDYYRIVIDEAHNIRNRSTKGSRCVARLNSTYRWCLTGTPLINGLTDAYGLLRFLRIRPWYDWKTFRELVTADEKHHPDLAGRRLQGILRGCQLRRRKDSKLEGKPLLELPPKGIENIEFDFSPEEREIYTFIETKQQIVFNKFLKEGTVLKNYSQLLVALLRLRQICDHIALITEECNPYEGDNSAEGKHDDYKKALKEAGHDFVVAVKKKLREKAFARMEAEKKELKLGRIEDREDEDECPICNDAPINNPVVTACTHVFCKECINQVLSQPPAYDPNNPSDYQPHEHACPLCRKAISSTKIFAQRAFEPTDRELKGPGGLKGGLSMKLDDDDEDLDPRKLTRKLFHLDSEDDDGGDPDEMKDFIVDDTEEDDEFVPGRASQKAKKGKGKGKEKNKDKKGKGKMVVDSSEAEESDDDLVMIKPGQSSKSSKKNSNPKQPVVQNALDEAKFEKQKTLPSAKMIWMMEKLQEWKKSAPDDKVLIISQFTSFLDIVALYLSEHGMNHVQYVGSMDTTERTTAVRKFQTGTQKYMLMSLKCGGVGLNLTRGNRVLSLDLAWSEAVEGQAFARVHRIGQKKEVFIYRPAIKNTVEQRIKALQERKSLLVDNSLGEGGGKKLGRLSVSELASLFNLNVRGEVLPQND